MIQSFNKTDLPDGFTVTAHTGCEGTQDNSLEAITMGYLNDADIVEFDLNFTKEGLPVLSHNTPENQKYVTLDEAFFLLTEYPSLQINVDVKNTANLTAVIKAAEKYGLLNRIFYTGITENDVEAAKSLTPNVPYYINIDINIWNVYNKNYILSLVENVNKLGGIGLNINHKSCSKKIVKIFHENGLLVSLWTANNKTDMNRCLKMLPDNITTRYPSELNDILA